MESDIYENDSQTRRRKIHCKQELIVKSLQRFYGEHKDIDMILGLLQGTSDISLRVIDWFVTNYAKAHNTAYIFEGQEFLVYTNYKSQLKAYSKKLFDPFCRRERIMFQVPGQPSFLTTVGKLNFFRWALEKGVLDHLRLNMTAVESEMNSQMRENAKVRKATPTNTTSTASTQQSTNTVATVSTVNTTKSSTRRRIVSKEQVSAKQMQKHVLEIKMSFD